MTPTLSCAPLKNSGLRSPIAAFSSRFDTAIEGSPPTIARILITRQQPPSSCSPKQFRLIPSPAPNLDGRDGNLTLLETKQDQIGPAPYAEFTQQIGNVKLHG